MTTQFEKSKTKHINNIFIVTLAKEIAEIKIEKLLIDIFCKKEFNKFEQVKLFLNSDSNQVVAKKNTNHSNRLRQIEEAKKNRNVHTFQAETCSDDIRIRHQNNKKVEISLQ